MSDALTDYFNGDSVGNPEGGSAQPVEKREGLERYKFSLPTKRTLSDALNGVRARPEEVEFVRHSDHLAAIEQEKRRTEELRIAARAMVAEVAQHCIDQEALGHAVNVSYGPLLHHRDKLRDALSREAE